MYLNYDERGCGGEYEKVRKRIRKIGFRLELDQERGHVKRRAEERQPRIDWLPATCHAMCHGPCDITWNKMPY